MVKRKVDPLSNANSREKIEQAALTLCRPQELQHARLEALGTLLSAYALGSRTAARGLVEYQRRFPGWALPPKEKAMELANEAFREAQELKAAHKDGDTRPGY